MKNKEEKRTSNKNFLDAWVNAINGIIYATTTQGNIKKQLIIIPRLHKCTSPLKTELFTGFFGGLFLCQLL